MLLSNPGNSLGRVIGDGMKPTDIAGCVLWIDTLERHTYVVTAGTGGQLGTVQSITNIASGVAWTEATSPPFFEPDGLDGRPCLFNDSSRRIISTDALPLTAVNGEDHACTIMLVMQAIVPNSNNIFCCADAGLEGVDIFRVGSPSAGTARMIRTDPAGLNGFTDAQRQLQPSLAPRLSAWRFNGTTISYWSDDDPSVDTQTPTNVAALSCTRSGIFIRPDLTPDGSTIARLGAIAMWDTALSDADVERMRAWFASRWLVGRTFPTAFPNLSCWLEDEKVGSTTVIQWTDKSGLGRHWGPPSGKEPTTAHDLRSSTIQFDAAGSDVFSLNTALATTAITVGVVFKLDVLPAAGTAYTILSPRMGTDKWFQFLTVNGSASYNDYTFSFHGAAGSSNVFGIDGETLDCDVHRLILTYDGSGTSPSDYQAMLDGVLKTITQKGGISRTTGDKGSLGAFLSAADATSNPMSGRLMKFVTVDRLMTASELAQLDAYLAHGWASFSPEVLSNRRVHFDMKDPASFQVTGGKVDSIRNKASNTLWTEATSPPEYEASAFQGFPCAKFDGVDDKIQSTEGAVIDVVDAADPAFAVYAVLQPITIDADQTWIGFGNSGFATSRTVRVGSQTSGAPLSGMHTIVKLDDAAAIDDATPAANTMPPTPHIYAWQVAGTTASGFLGDGPADPSVASLDVGTLTPNQVALGCRPDSVPDFFGNFRLAELLMFGANHTEGDARFIARRLKAKWGIDFNPMAIAGLVAWFDMNQSSSYTVSGGTVTSIKNLATNVAWNTAATNFPLYEADGMKGRPCMRGGRTANGVGAVNRGLLSTEAGVVNAFVGDDKPITLMAVVEPVNVAPSAAEMLFAVADATIDASQHRNEFRREATTGAWRFVRRDASSTVSPTRSAAISNLPQVLTWLIPGTTASCYVNAETTPDPNTASANVGVVTPTRAGLFAVPDLTLDAFSGDRISEFLVFNRALTDIERVKATAYLMTKWGIS